MGDEHDNDGHTSEQMRVWREHYGDMIPERIVDTRVDENGKRYYKVQWASTTMEAGMNFLEAEHLVKKYWNPTTKKLDMPGLNTERPHNTDEEVKERTHNTDDEEAGTSKDGYSNAFTSTNASTSSDIATTSSDIVSTSSDIASTSSDIATTSSDIATTSSDIVSTSSDIASTSSDIASTSSDIATTSSDIAVTSSDIATTSSAITVASSDIATTSSAITVASSDIASSNTTNYITEHDNENDTTNVTKPDETSFTIRNKSYSEEEHKAKNKPLKTDNELHHNKSRVSGHTDDNEIKSKKRKPIFVERHEDEVQENKKIKLREDGER